MYFIEPGNSVMEKLKKFLNPFWGIVIIMILSTILILPSISNSMLWKDAVSYTHLNEYEY